MTDFQDSALLLAAHGSSYDPEAGILTQTLVAQLRQLNLFGEVEAAFWKEEPFFRDALAKLHSNRVFIVPNFISHGYFTETVLPREFGLRGKITQLDGKTVYYCDPIGTHALMTEALLHAAQMITQPEIPDPRQTCLLVVGHGTLRNKNSATVIHEKVREIAQLQRYAECKAAFMEEEPLVRNWLSLTACPQVIVAPFFIAGGPHFNVDLPQLLGIEGGERQWPVQVEGRSLWCAKPVGYDERMIEVILTQVRAISE